MHTKKLKELHLRRSMNTTPRGNPGPIPQKLEPTPGPWMLSKGLHDNINVEAMFEGTLGYVATLSGNNTKANALLIASAPELLSALRALFEGTEVYNACGQVYPPKVEALMIQAGEAIRKALGGAE